MSKDFVLMIIMETTKLRWNDINLKSVPTLSHLILLGSCHFIWNSAYYSVILEIDRNAVSYIWWIYMKHNNMKCQRYWSKLAGDLLKAFSFLFYENTVAHLTFWNPFMFLLINLSSQCRHQSDTIFFKGQTGTEITHPRGPDLRLDRSRICTRCSISNSLEL